MRRLTLPLAPTAGRRSATANAPATGLSEEVERPFVMGLIWGAVSTLSIQTYCHKAATPDVSEQPDACLAKVTVRRACRMIRQTSSKGKRGHGKQAEVLRLGLREHRPDRARAGPSVPLRRRSPRRGASPRAAAAGGGHRPRRAARRPAGGARGRPDARSLRAAFAYLRQVLSGDRP